MSKKRNMSISQNEESGKSISNAITENIVIGNYTIEKVIGEGTFGKVYRGLHLGTGEKVPQI